MKATLVFLFGSLIILFCGCRGLQSELQKSSHSAAAPTAVIGETELRLDTKLRRVYIGEGFDLVGTINVLSERGDLPTGFTVNHFTLRPSWKGFPGYYVLNFSRRNGAWQAPDGNLLAFTRNKRDRETIEFTLQGQGRGTGKKQEHFAAYDVSVTVTDATGKRHVLAQSAVPTE